MKFIWLYDRVNLEKGEFMEMSEEQKEMAARAMILGVIVGLMIAPQSGEATRKQLRYKIEKMKDKLREKIMEISMMDKEGYMEKVDEFLQGALEEGELEADEVPVVKDGLMELYDKIQEEWA